MYNLAEKIRLLLIITMLGIYLGFFISFLKFLDLATSKYTSEEIEIAKVISAEACGEDKIGMIAVANTIMNRAKLWNKSPYEIVTQKNQYYGYTAKNKEILFLSCQHIALPIVKNINQLEDITNNAIYFRTKHEPIRRWHKRKTVTIKNHIFYK